ncbi:hypothetical protein [Microbacterium luticocti]|uniref:hypothetical protein n=1 Tax=Microbacterium luticocti TaxID=451764 RepID=UPI000417844E|nr:hypothetical protein [Microbacterium luticocti]
MRRVVLFLAAAAAALAASVASTGAAAQATDAAGPVPAATTTQVVAGPVLRLVSVADWAAASRLQPGQPVHWDVTVSANAPSPGTVRIGVSATGRAPLVIAVARCTRAWTPSGCPGVVTVLRTDWVVPRDGTEVPLVRMAAADVARLRLTVTVAAGARGTSALLVHAHGWGQSQAIAPGGDLPRTGGLPGSLPWLLDAGAVLLVVGVLLVARRHRRPHARRAARPAPQGSGP